MDGLIDECKDIGWEAFAIKYELSDWREDHDSQTKKVILVSTFLKIV